LGSIWLQKDLISQEQIWSIFYILQCTLQPVIRAKPQENITKHSTGAKKGMTGFTRLTFEVLWSINILEQVRVSICDFILHRLNVRSITKQVTNYSKSGWSEVTSQELLLPLIFLQWVTLGISNSAQKLIAASTSKLTTNCLTRGSVYCSGHVTPSSF